jgi:hypothetical protein
MLNVNDLNKAIQSKPSDLIISDLKWKYLLWSILKGKNVLVIGPTRSGKNKAIQSAVKVLGRENVFFYFNMGSTQDARSMLIGNTFFKKETGTVFSKSAFVKAITTKNAVILLDELSRGHHDAWNILMSVLDSTQRYLRLDESETSEIIPVADGVSFVSTANIGTEYTATRTIDKAVSSRFPVKIEMEPLSKKDELSLLTTLYPGISTSSKDTFESLCSISNHTRQQVKQEDSKIFGSSFISTGAVVEMAELVVGGFSLTEIAEVSIYPEYSSDGGVDSERTYIKQLVQKYIKPSNTPSPINDPVTSPPVNTNTIPF